MQRLAQVIVQTFPRLLGLLLIWTAIVKIRDPYAVQTVLRFDVLPAALITPAVWTIIAVEMVLGALLLSFVILKRTSLIMSIALLSVYSIQLGYLLLSTDAPSCGCIYGEIEYEQARRANFLGLLRNICLIVPACWTLMQIPRSKLQLRSLPSESGGDAVLKPPS